MPITEAQLIINALREPTAAIPYTIVLDLKALRPTSVILQGRGHGFDVERFAGAGHCQVSDHHGFTNVIDTHWHGEPWGICHNSVIRWLDVVWQGHRLEVIEASWDAIGCHQNRHWLIADGREAAEAFWTAVCQWNLAIRGEILVFNEGEWQKDEDLFAAIAGTHYETLVMPPLLKEDIHNDLRHFLDSRAIYERYRIPWKRGILLAGPPGNGKTHCVKGLVNRLGIACLYVKSFSSSHYSEQSCIQRVFEYARKTTPCILVLEDLDSMINDGNRSYFLNELDGFAANTGLITLATTNHPDRLDVAIRDRPSRFDRTWNFPLPRHNERARYIAQWSDGLQQDLRLASASIEAVALATEGFSFAYLKELFISAIMRWINVPDLERDMPTVLVAQASLLRSQMAAAHSTPVARVSSD